MCLELRKATGYGMMDCKYALQENAWDINKAKVYFERFPKNKDIRHMLQTSMKSFISLFDKNSFVKKGRYYKHDDLLNITICDSSMFGYVKFTLGYQNYDGSFFGMNKNIRTVNEMQEVLLVLCDFKTKL